VTAVYPELGALAAAAGRRTLVRHGEIVALSGPRPDFTALQRRMTAGRPGGGLLAAVPVTLIVFDVLRSGRDHLAGRPYVLRRALLEDLGLQVPGAVQVPPAFPGDAAAPPRASTWSAPRPGGCASRSGGGRRPAPGERHARSGP
jgi:bifunctional non-homologous end joining protein LigD